MTIVIPDALTGPSQKTRSHVFYEVLVEVEGPARWEVVMSL